MPNPNELAQEIAHLLRNDPIAACQVKEFIPPDELATLLEIEAEGQPQEALKEVLQNFTLVEVLQAFRDRPTAATEAAAEAAAKFYKQPPTTK